MGRPATSAIRAFSSPSTSVTATCGHNAGPSCPPGRKQKKKRQVVAFDFFSTPLYTYLGKVGMPHSFLLITSIAVEIISFLYLAVFTRTIIIVPPILSNRRPRI